MFPNRIQSSTLCRSLPLLVLVLAICAGCERAAVDPNLADALHQAGLARGGQVADAAHAEPAAAKAAAASGYPAPSGRVTVPLGGGNVSLWPYTGAGLDGTASDPVNLLFTGAADPVAIRNALLSLDGNRTALEFPPVPPFNARWSDAIGDVQATYVDGEGWTGSVIQLQLGDYAPLRVHLRLFRVGAALADGGSWTVGAAHFEVLIPGTADHQVLSWELAEQIVAADLARSGLLAAGSPSTTPLTINDAPSFRTIPSVIYNGLPAELAALTGGPAAPVAADVPIATDGRATVLQLAGRAPAAGPRAQRFTLTYGQVVPRPLCSQGPYDYILVQGPVTFSGAATVGADGHYAYRASYEGKLTAVPVDVTQDPPAPAGDSFEAHVGEQQRGSLTIAQGEVSAVTRRLVPRAGGSEFEHRFLRVATDGALRYDVDTQCR